MKLKEISYIHAEGYPAGEMKHGPIALIDERPAHGHAGCPDNECWKRSQSNLQEVRARGGRIIALTDERPWPGDRSRPMN